MADLRQWLNSLGLGQYGDAFEENAVGWDVLSHLDHDVLKDMGISAAGDRIRILKAIESIKTVSNPGEAWEGTNNRLRQPSAVGEAERRQLTVMFADLVGSTELSQELDPEDLRVVNRTYQDTAKTAIEDNGGYLARYMGDGVLAYFGYPQAHESDAEQAVNAGLVLTKRVTELESIVPLAVRIGIATGPVVVGDIIGEGAAQESAVVGETPNLAARLQGEATPNSVVISQTTQTLTAGLFEFETLPPRALKGIANPVSLYRVQGQLRGQSRFAARSGAHLSPFVGREDELEQLTRRWLRAEAGQGQVALITGEAGIGKSRLLQQLRERHGAQSTAVIALQCSPYHQSTALYPVITAIESGLQIAQITQAELRLKALRCHLEQLGETAEHSVGLFADLLSIPTGGQVHGVHGIDAAQRREKTLEALVDYVRTCARLNSLLCVFEDIHWADPTTLELVGRLVDAIESERILLIATTRPGFEASWSDLGHASVLSLSRLGPGDSALLAQDVASVTHELPNDVVQTVLSRAGGNPLFIEELTRSVAGSAHSRTAQPNIPVTLQDSLMARLDASRTGKAVAQCAAVIGRSFEQRLLAHLWEDSPEQLAAGLDALEQAGLISHRGHGDLAQYLFKHALIQDAAYASLLRESRAQLHSRVVAAYDSHYPELRITQPELLARHYAEAGQVDESIRLWLDAGKRAASRHANQEAVNHFNAGLQLVAILSDGQARDELELDLQVGLGAALQTLSGPGGAAVAAAYNRAYELCRKLGATPNLFETVYGLWKHAVFKAEGHKVDVLAARLSELESSAEHPEQRVLAQYALQYAALNRAELDIARTEQERGVACYARLPPGIELSRFGQNPSVAFHVYAGLTLWLQGYPEQAARRCHEGIALARTLQHPYSLAFSFDISLVVFHSLRELSTVEEMSEEMIALSRQHGFKLWQADAQLWEGWAKSVRDPHGLGVSQMRTSIEAVHSAGGEVWTPHMHAALAAACLDTGQIDTGLEAVADALAHIRRSGECWWESETYRLHAALLQARQEDPPKVVQLFEQALRVARNQGAKSLELRAATGMASLLCEKGKKVEAQALLTPVYNWFTEGRNTSDLTSARKVLAQLS